MYMLGFVGAGRGWDSLWWGGGGVEVPVGAAPYYSMPTILTLTRRAVPPKYGKGGRYHIWHPRLSYEGTEATAGVEPATHRTAIGCSAAELRRLFCC